jgi:hypothetical protein
VILVGFCKMQFFIGWKDALDCDYELLVYLSQNAADSLKGEAAIEERMLEIYSVFIRAWYSAANHFSPPDGGDRDSRTKTVAVKPLFNK